MHNVLELLPIGSVIRLRGARKNLMVIGVCQTNTETNQDYDYLGVLWPEGNMGGETQIMFQHADIEQVFFTGMDNEERQGFIERLNAYYESRN